MSLFGGPQPPPPTSPPSAQVAATFASSPSPHPSSELPTAPTYSIEHDAEDDASYVDTDDNDHDEGEDDDDDDDDDDAEGRPNKFTGTASAWKRHAANEVELHNALSQLEANDLSKHLYLAHSLQSRLRGPSATSVKSYQSKSRWIETDAQVKHWVPPRLWTAWPLEPDEVPRKWERFGEIPDIDPEDEFTYREEGFLKGKPSRDLEELVLSVILRKAKEQWNSRHEERDVEQTRCKPRRRRNGKARAAGDQDNDSPSSSDIDAKPQASRRTRENTEATSDSQHLETSALPPLSKPVVTADDEVAQRLIQPAIRSLLSNLDSVLLALHRSRKNLFDDADESVEDEETNTSSTKKRKRTGPEAESEPEIQPHPEAEPGTKRGPGRPRVFKTYSPVSAAQARGAAAEEGAKRSKGRPKKTTLLPGESYYMRKKRLKAEAEAQAQAETQAELEATVDENTGGQPEPTREPTRACRPPPLRAVSKHPRRSSDTSDSSDDSRTGVSRPSGTHAYGLRDWSEMLSTASLIGAFKSSVIHRAAQRCSNIFNESMRFHILEERNALREGAGDVVEYKPGFIAPPDFDDPGDVTESQSEDAELSDDESETSGEEEKSQPAWDGISTNCPHNSCDRHLEPFDGFRPLCAHVQMKHGYLLLQKKDKKGKAPESVGAVHNDGFLQPIASRHGWRSRDVVQREKHGNGSRSMKRGRIRRGSDDSEDDGDGDGEGAKKDGRGQTGDAEVKDVDDRDDTAVEET